MSGDCQRCADRGRRGYCAPGRCYCGHPTCHAFASYVDISNIASIDAPTKTRTRSTTWDDREESTWIDKL